MLCALTAELAKLEDEGADWEVLPSLGVIMSDTCVPVPDTLIRPARAIAGPACDDMLVAFEVLSPS